MIFEKELVFFQSKKVNTKSGEYNFVTLVDVDRYDKEDFFVDSSLNLDNFKSGDVVICKFEFKQYNGRNYIRLKEIEEK